MAYKFVISSKAPGQQDTVCCRRDTRANFQDHAMSNAYLIAKAPQLWRADASAMVVS